MRRSLLLATILLLVVATPAGAVTTFGSTLAAAPDGLAEPCPGAAPVRCTAVRASEGAPADGVLLRWRVVADASAVGSSVTLRVVRGVTVAGESEPHVLTLGTQTVAVRLAVRRGDRVALSSADPLPAVFAAAGGDTQVTSEPAGSSTSTRELLLNADLEPDLDGDRFGDETEDACPYDPARTTACRADLRLTAGATASTVIGEEASHVYTVRNAGPSGAAAVTVTAPVAAGFVRATMPGATCTVAGGSVGCRGGLLPAGGEISATLVLTATEPGVVSTSARVGSDADEAKAGDEDAGASTRFTPPSVPPPPVVLPMIACSNRFDGGRDDDALFGTPFGDRLVGLGGRDLLRGRAGDDCLEGGAGNDVLDGGEGADRLLGGLGRDRLLGGPGDDRLRGGLKNDRLSGGPGSDVLEPGPGADSVDGGAGNDRISSRDGVRETIDCGPGLDRVHADRRDRLRRCEQRTP